MINTLSFLSYLIIIALLYLNIIFIAIIISARIYSIIFLLYFLDQINIFFKYLIKITILSS